MNKTDRPLALGPALGRARSLLAATLVLLAACGDGSEDASPNPPRSVDGGDAEVVAGRPGSGGRSGSGGASGSPGAGAGSEDAGSGNAGGSDAGEPDGQVPAAMTSLSIELKGCLEQNHLELTPAHSLRELAERVAVIRARCGEPSDADLQALSVLLGDDL